MMRIALSAAAFTLASIAVAAASDPVPVNVSNFGFAESDLNFGRMVKENGIGKLGHEQEPTPIDEQTVIRMNRDTLYSSGVFDLSAGPSLSPCPHAPTSGSCRSR